MTKRQNLEYFFRHKEKEGHAVLIAQPSFIAPNSAPNMPEIAPNQRQISTGDYSCIVIRRKRKKPKNHWFFNDFWALVSGGDDQIWTGEWRFCRPPGEIQNLRLYLKFQHWHFCRAKFCAKWAKFRVLFDDFRRCRKMSKNSLKCRKTA